MKSVLLGELLNIRRSMNQSHRHFVLINQLETLEFVLIGGHVVSAEHLLEVLQSVENCIELREILHLLALRVIVEEAHLTHQVAV